jgi:cysteinyl-tRNA synthetase
MDDDFNTAQALGYVFETVRLLNQIATEKGARTAENMKLLVSAKNTLDYFGSVLGVFQSDPDQFFDTDKEQQLDKRGLKAEIIEEKIHQRNLARAAKDWATADAIRAQLAELHVVLKDSAQGTQWIIE